MAAGRTQPILEPRLQHLTGARREPMRPWHESELATVVWYVPEEHEDLHHAVAAERPGIGRRVVCVSQKLWVNDLSGRQESRYSPRCHEV